MMLNISHNTVDVLFLFQVNRWHWFVIITVFYGLYFTLLFVTDLKYDAEHLNTASKS